MTRQLGIWIVLFLAASACLADDNESTPRKPLGTDLQIMVIAEGLLNPVGMALLPTGEILVAEEGTGQDDLSAGVSLITTRGEVGRVISGLPSGRDSGDLSGVPLVAVSPTNDLLYLSHFGAGGLLTVRLNDIDLNFAEPLQPEQLGRAMEPLNNVRLTNPFDLTFDADGAPVVSDASQNGVAIETADGTTRFIHRFDQIAVPNSPRVDAVPTGIERQGDEYYVTLFGGCPYPVGSGRLVAVDDDRNERTVISDLSLPIDVAAGLDDSLWVLEFATFERGASCFTGEGYTAETGTLSRFDESRGELTTIMTGLNHPGSVLPLEDGSVLVTEIFAGRVLRILPDAQTPLRPATQAVVGAASWQFTNQAEEAGLDFGHGSFATHVSPDPVAAMGGGLCWIDVDRDGWLDLYLVNSHSLDEETLWAGRGGVPTNALYKNRNGMFVEVGTSSGADLAMRGNACAVADFNGDGFDDLFVTADGPNALLLNDGKGRFSETAQISGLDASEWNSAAVAGDVNGDGRVDLFVAAYIDLEVTVPKPVGAFPQDFAGLPDHLYLNLGNDATGRPRFEDIGIALGTSIDGRGWERS